MAVNEYGLTPKEETFAREKAKGKTNVEAYEAAGYNPNSSRTTKRRNAYAVTQRPKVAERIAQLQKAVEAEEILSIAQIQANLTEIALDDSNSKNVKLKALDQLAKTKGAYSDNVNVTTSGSLSIADKKEAFKELLGE